MAEKEIALFTLGEVGEILGSNSEGDPGFHRAPVFGVSTDSRTVRDGELFIAIKGETYDGHAFLAQALSKGAVAAVVSRAEARRRGLIGPEYFAVDDTLFALGELARHHRVRMPAMVAAVTGSNGKTTVKNLIHEVISRHGPSVKSLGNFNNLIGLPASIFQLRNEHKFAVFELGMSARGEIERLGQIAGPDVAVITNVGPVHLEFLGNVDEVAEAKVEVLGSIRDGGTLIINGDDEILARHLGVVGRRVVRFGLDEGNDIAPMGLRFDNRQMASFAVDGVLFSLLMPGIYSVHNALAAFAVARALGVDDRSAAAAINTYRPEAMRSEIVPAGGLTLIVDCYNANPASMRFALETLSKMRCGGRRIAVLADMLELGPQAFLYHEELGRQARELLIDHIFGFGPLTRYTVERFGKGAWHFDDKEGLSKSLSETIKAGDIILFKGSRGMALEEVVDRIKKMF